jgi:hypothetical protein
LHVTQRRKANPYEPPKELRSNFADGSPSDLELRVAALERQISNSWLHHRNIFVRVFGVWAYIFIGYLILAAIMAPFMLLTNWLFP